jgi:hypothetical protein
MIAFGHASNDYKQLFSLLNNLAIYSCTRSKQLQLPPGLVNVSFFGQTIFTFIGEIVSP